MAPLTLTIVRGPGAGPDAFRQVGQSGWTIGRGADCHWALDDPRKSISRSHCLLRLGPSGWEVMDTSTNGTYVNGAEYPIGRNQVQTLRNGDRLRLGDFEIEVALGVRPVETRDAPVHSPTKMFGGAPARAEPAKTEQIPSDWLAGLGLPFNPEPLIAELPDLDRRPATEPVSELDLTSRGTLNAFPAADAATPARPGIDAGAALLHFLDGAGLPADLAARLASDPETSLRNAGAILRVAISGMRKLLIARGEVKREFRIEQTLLQIGSNNFLKFAGSDDLALQALLDPQKDGVAAVEKTVSDLTGHEMAVMAAMQVAAGHLLDELDPARLGGDTGPRKFIEAPEKRLWEAYKLRHRQLRNDFNDNFDSVFGKEFARAYERALGGDKN